MSAELSREQFECILAEDGRAAMHALRERPFDAVVTDVRMNGMDGLELITEARRFRPELPVIVVTGFATIAAAVDAMKRGAYHYLTKPLEGAELRKVVRAAVTGGADRAPDGDPCTLDEVIRRHVASVLLKTGGDKVAAARILGVHVSTLYRWQHGWRRRESLDSGI